MLEKTTTFGLLGILAAAAGAALTGDGTNPIAPDPTTGPVLSSAPIRGVQPRFVDLAADEYLALDGTPAVPGGAAPRAAQPAIAAVDVAIDESIRELVTGGLRAGAGSFARFDGWSGGDVILRLLNHRAEAAIACRQPSPGERRRGVGGELLGDLVVVVVAHPSNPLGSLPSGSVRDLVRGATRDWARLGGKPGAIRMVLPPPGPQADLYARILARGDKMAENATFASTDDERIRLVMNDPKAIAVVTLEAARRAQAPTLRIDGVPPSLGALRTGRYPFGTPIVLVHRGSAGAVELTSALRQPNARRALGMYLTMGGR